MDMSWQAMLYEAAAVSFERNTETLAADDSTCFFVDFHQSQIRELSEKILRLPHQGIVLLFSRYCFRLSPEEAEKFFHLKNAKGRFRFHKRLLSSCMGFDEDHMISDTTFGTACNSALKKYLHNELETDAKDDAAGMSRTYIAFRRVGRTVAVVAVTLAMLFSICMVANAQFRERVISWVVETFEKYSIFELNTDGQDERQDLMDYQTTYLPAEAVLQNTVEQPEIVVYEFAISESQHFNVVISRSDTRLYLNTENAEIEQFDKDGVTGYFFKKDDMKYICFEQDGCFFSVYGSIDTDELIKIAAGIAKK